MAAAQVLLLLFWLGAAAAAPLTDREKQNRIVAVSKSKGSLLSAAVSKASPDLLRVALTASEPGLLKTALTEADPELLIAALNNVDPDLLTVALTKSDPKLLETALTAAKSELLKTALNAPTNAAILEVALTLSDPELLAVALQDATVENLIIALTAADGSLGTPDRTSSKFNIDESKNPKDSIEGSIESDESSESDESIESDESDESDESSESYESSESDESNDFVDYDKLKASIDFHGSIESGDIKTTFQHSPLEPSGPVDVASIPSIPIVKTEGKESFERFPAVPYGALSSSVQNRLANIQTPSGGNPESSLLNTVQGTDKTSPTGNGYGALSPSIQTRLGAANTAPPTGTVNNALSSTGQSMQTGHTEQSGETLSSYFLSSRHQYGGSRLSLSHAVEQVGISASPLNYEPIADSVTPFGTGKAPSPVDDVPFFIPGLSPLVRIPSHIYTNL